jgi:hypothetical protein
MARVLAVFYDGDVAVSAFKGSQAHFEANRDNENLPWRVLTGTPWGDLPNYRGAPTLTEFDAWVAAQAPDPLLLT